MSNSFLDLDGLAYFKQKNDKRYATKKELDSKPQLCEGIADTISAGTAQEFLQRQSGGDGVNCIKRIKGKTIAWNQLINIYGVNDANGVTATLNSDGTVTLNGTATNAGSVICAFSPIYLAAGHKVLFYSVGTVTAQIPSSLTGSFFTSNGGSIITIAQNGEESRLWLRFNGGDSFSNKKIYTYLTDLTLLYGSEISGMTDAQILAKFQAEYPALYYAYNPGVLKSNDAAALFADGRNQWDEEWLKGFYTAEEGMYSDGDGVCSKNKIPIFPNTQYYIKSGSYAIRQRFYRKDGSYIGYGGQITSEGILTTPRDAYYMHLCILNESTYKNDICISFSGSRNGEYEPYWQRVLALRLSELTGIPEGGTEADRVTMFPNGAGGAGSDFDSIFVENGVTKARNNRLRVNFGGLTYTRTPRANAPTEYKFVSIETVQSLGCVPSSTNNICAKYAAGDPNAVGTDKVFAVGSYINIADNTYTDAAAFKAAMDGIYIEMALATPIVYTDLQYADGTPFTMPATILVDNYGTERIEAPEGATTPSAPFCCDSNYSISIANLVKKLNSNE